MLSTRGATISVAATVIILLAIALVSLAVWQRHELEALSLSASTGASVVTIERTTDYVPLVLTSGVAGLLWVALVIIPTVFAARRFASGVSTHLITAAVVGVLSALAFCSFRPAHSILPLAVFLSIGGLIGLAGLGVALRALPPNNSLERTRAR
jgi:hypothetical protein